MNLNITTIIKQQGLFIGLGVLNPLISFLLIPVHIKYFSPSEYGLLYLLYMIGSLSVILASCNLTASVKTFYFDLDEIAASDYTDKMVKYMAITGAIYMVLVSLLGPFLIEALFDPAKIEYSYLIPLSICAFLIRNLVHAYQVYLRNARKNKLLSQLTLLNSGLFLVLQLLLIIYLRIGIESVFYAMILSNSAGLALILVKEGRSLRSSTGDIPTAKSIRYGLSLLPLFLMEWLIIRGDRFFVQDRFDLALLGQYALAMNIALLLSFVTSSYLNAARPELYQSFKEIQRGAYRDFFSLYILFLGIIVIASAGIYSLTILLPYLSAEEKYLAITTILPLAILVIVIRSHTRMIYEYYDCFKQTAPLIYFTGINFTCFLLMIYWIPTELGLRGILYSLLVSNFLCFGVALGYTFLQNKGTINLHLKD